MKGIIYILGGGRSGSTLLDIMLGNADGAFSCGELRRLPFHGGHPRAFPPGSPGDRFWRDVESRLQDRMGTVNWHALDRLSHSVEYHTRFLAPWRTRQTNMKPYGEYANALFEVLFEVTGADWLIDSSKYPGRLLSLLSVTHVPLYVIWLVRHPVAVVHSFSRRGIEQPPKGFLAANLYYGLNSVLCRLAWKRVPPDRRIRIRYEDLVREPVPILERVGKIVPIDLTVPIDRARQGAPFQVGCLVDGNRMRLASEITVKEPEPAPRHGPGAWVTRLLNGIWY